MKHKLIRSIVQTVFLLGFLVATGRSQVDLQQKLNTGLWTAAGHARTENVPAHPIGMTAVPEDVAALKIGPGFLLVVTVLDDSDLNGNFRVDQMGEINIPNLGKINVARQTATEAAELIRKKILAEQLLRNPQVAVNITEYSLPEIAITGEVGAPGKYSILTPKKLVAVLALAGGTTQLAGNEVRIGRATAGEPAQTVRFSRSTGLQSAEDVLIYPGDSVLVQRAGVVYVLGAVGRAGGYIMQEEGTLSLLQAVALAGGPTFAASTNSIYLLRRSEDGATHMMPVRYHDVAHGKVKDVAMQPSDILFVPDNKAKSWLTNMQGILSAAASASIYATRY